MFSDRLKAPWSPKKGPIWFPSNKKTLFFTIILYLSESLEKAPSRELSYGSTGDVVTDPQKLAEIFMKHYNSEASVPSDDLKVTDPESFFPFIISPNFKERNEESDINEKEEEGYGDDDLCEIQLEPSDNEPHNQHTEETGEWMEHQFWP